MLKGDTNQELANTVLLNKPEHLDFPPGWDKLPGIVERRKNSTTIGIFWTVEILLDVNFATSSVELMELILCTMEKEKLL